LSDDIIVLANGRALQAGATSETFGRPASPEVARLLGIPNLNRGEITTPGWMNADGIAIAVDSGGITPGSVVLWGIRPERVALLPSSELAGILADVADVGTAVDLVISLSPHLKLHARTTHPFPMKVGGAYNVSLPREAITLCSQTQ
jgi:ABC-type sugar transport system ATPase subunit